MMVCDATVVLTIKTPVHTTKELRTDNNGITVNPECKIKDLVTVPDYEAEYLLEHAGTYELSLTATTKNGTYTIEDEIQVTRDTVPFVVERESATRIYPIHAYPVKLSITANQDFNGEIVERVPYEFKINNVEKTTQPFSYISFNKSTTQNYRYQDITWNVDLKKGQTITLGYTYDAPDKSPYFFLIGPLRFSHSQDTSAGHEKSASFNVVFKEQRAWQIAVDDISSNLQQQVNIMDQEYTTTSQTSVPTDNSLGLVKFDGSKYNDESVYFETLLHNDSTDDVLGNIGSYPSMFCVTSDDCKLVYSDDTNFTLRFKDCDDETCSTGSITILDGAPGCALTNCTTKASSFNAKSLYCVASNDCKIAYRSGNPIDLMFADCDNETCTNGTLTVLDNGTDCTLTGCTTSGSPGDFISLDCSQGTSDCKVAYLDHQSDLVFGACNTATCSSGTKTVLDGRSGCVISGCSSSITISYLALDCRTGAADCKIAYHDHTNGDLLFLDCDSASCTSGTRSLLDGNTSCTLTECSTTASAGDAVDIYCVTTNDCKIIYIDDTGDDIYFADCDTATCSTGARTLLDGSTGCSLSGCSTSVTFPPTGDPTYRIDCTGGTDDCKVAYISSSAFDLFFGDCSNSACTSGTRSRLEGASGCTLTNCETGIWAVTYYVDLACPSADNCKLLYPRGLTVRSTYFGDCANTTCSAGSSNYIDGNGPGSHTVGENISMNCPTADNCKIAYSDTTNNSLRFLDCDDINCSTGTHLILDGATGCVLTGCSTSASAGAPPAIDCPTSDNCKIAYYRSTNLAFFADCNAETCNVGSTRNMGSLKSGGPVEIDCTHGSDDCKVITVNLFSELLFYDCNDETCTDVDASTIDGASGCVITGCTTGNVAAADLSCIGGSDDCKVVHYNQTTTDLIFTDCDSVDCSTGTASPVDGSESCTLTNCGSSGIAPGNLSRIFCINASDCKIVYLKSSDLYFADCDNATCTSGTVTLLDGAADCSLTNCTTSPSNSFNLLGLYCISTDDCKAVSYMNSGLAFADCDNATCTSGTRTFLDGGESCVLTNCTSVGGPGRTAAIDCTGGSADCKIAYHDSTNKTLHFADCSTNTCSSGSTRIVDDKNEIVFAQLYDASGTAVPDGIVSLQSDDGVNRVRSGNTLNLVDTSNYTVRTRSSNGGVQTTARLKAARLIIPQNGSKLTDTQTQIEIGNNETTTQTEYTALAAPKVVNFNPGKYSDEPEIYFEATIKNSGANTTTAILSTDATCTSTISESEISTSGTTWSLVRTSESITESLASSNYYVCIKASGGTASIANAKIIVNQSNPSGIGYLQTYTMLGNTLSTDNDNTYTDQNFLNAIYTGAYGGQYQTEAYYETTIKTSAGTGYTRLKNDTDNQTLSNSAVSTTSTSYTRVRSGNIFDNLPSTAKNLDMQISNSATNITSVAGSWVIIEFVPPPPQIEGNNFNFEGIGFD